MRYFLEISYNGKKYHGWQMQENAHSVQSQLNAGLEQLFGFPIVTIASGRTDTGVHASQQFVQVDMPAVFTKQHVFSLNRILPFDIAIHQVLQVKSDAHARFDAVSRTYEYRMAREKNPFYTDLSYHFSKDLDVLKMNEACKILFEYEDFECFSKVKTSVDHFRCQMYQAFWEDKNGFLIFTIEANRFLRGMVRSVVGTLLEIGLERKAPDHLHKIIASKNRKAAGRSVPAHGLFLTKIKYPEDIWIS